MLEIVSPNLKRLEDYAFEIGPIRPPSEGGSSSLLIRATRNCPWSRCTFCYALPYNRETFELRPLQDIKKDIEAVRAICEVVGGVSWKLGLAGRVDGLVGAAILRANPRLQSQPSFVTVFNWLASGARTVFLQDANTLVMRSRDLVEVVRHLKQTFPSVERVTSYARSHTASRKSPEELRALREAGLTRLHIGLESGDGEVLKAVDKGVTAAGHILAGRKVKEAGIELSQYVMPGLAGRARWEEHARGTALVLNEIDPDYVRLRPFVPRPHTPLFDAYARGEMELTSPHHRLREIKLMVGLLEFTGRLCFDHLTNCLYREDGHFRPLFDQDYEGYKFPEHKSEVLALVEKGLAVDESRFLSAEDMARMPNL